MKASTLRPVKTPRIEPSATAGADAPPVPSGGQIRAARTLSRLTRLLVRSYGEKTGRKILIEAVQQRLRTKKDIRDIVATRVIASGTSQPAATGVSTGLKR